MKHIAARYGRTRQFMHMHRFRRFWTFHLHVHHGKAKFRRRELASCIQMWSAVDGHALPGSHHNLPNDCNAKGKAGIIESGSWGLLRPVGDCLGHRWQVDGGAVLCRGS